MLLGCSGSTRYVTQGVLEHGKAEQGRKASAKQDSEPNLVELSGGVECQSSDNEAHGESNTRETGDAVDLRPCCAVGQTKEASLDPWPGEGQNTRLLAYEQAKRDAERQGLCQCAQRDALEGNACISPARQGRRASTARPAWLRSRKAE